MLFVTFVLFMLFVLFVRVESFLKKIINKINRFEIVLMTSISHLLVFEITSAVLLTSQLFNECGTFR